MCQFVLAARYWIISFTHTIEIGLRHWWLWTKNCFVLFKRRPARTLAVRFSECRENQIARTTEQRALRRFVYLIHFFLAKFAWSAVVIQNTSHMTPSAIFIQVLRICMSDEVNLHNRRLMSQARRMRHFAWSARRVRRARLGEEKNIPRSLHERCVPIG